MNDNIDIRRECDKCSEPMETDDWVSFDGQIVHAKCAPAFPSEQEMRDAEVPWVKTEEELIAYIRSLVDRPHDYGTSAYAMSLAAVAAFHYMAHKVGASGFQAGWADMDFIRRTRHLKSGFRLVVYEKLLYPQYCNTESFPSRADLEREHKDELRRLAKEKLAEGYSVHPEVKARWEELAAR